MTESFKIKAEPRALFGRKVKSLRKEGKLPANIFGKEIKSTPIIVELKDFLKVFKEAGETKIVNIDLNGQTLPTLIHSIQKDPVSGDTIHADFLKVNLKQKVSAQVPVEFIGESPAEKRGEGIVVKYIDEIEIEALPTEIPDKFEIDLSRLENVGDQVLVGDLKYSKEKIQVLEDLGKVIVKVEELRKEEPETTPPLAEETGEAEVPVAEGEEKMEGEIESKTE